MIVLAGVALALAATVLPGEGSGPTLLRTINTVPLPGPAARFDYASLDTTTGRLYVAHMGAGTLLVFDTHTQQPLADLPGFPGATGVLAIPDLGKVFVSVTALNPRASGEVAVVDQATQRVTDHIPAGRFPDGISYDPGRHRVQVSNEFGKSLTVLDAINGHVLATIDVGGEAGNNRYDSERDLIWVAVQSRDEIVAVDPESWRVTARYSTPAGTHPHGMFVVADRGLLFVAGEASGRLEVFDLPARQFGASWPVGPSPDVLTYDPGIGRLYVASESGNVSVFAVEGRQVTKLGDQFVALGAHAIEVDPASHQLYLPIRALRGRPTMLVMAPADSPVPIAPGADNGVSRSSPIPRSPDND